MSNKLTLNKMKNIAAPTYEQTILTYHTEGGEVVNIEFDTELSLIDISTFVDTVADGVFAFEEYIPEYRDVMTFVALINISNIPIPKKKVKDGDDVVDIKLAYEWMQKLGIIERLKYQDDELYNLVALYNKLNPMITDKIEFKKQEILSAQRMELAKSQFELDMAISTLSQFSEQFKDVDINDIANNVNKIANLDPKQLTENIIDIQAVKNKE